MDEQSIEFRDDRDNTIVVGSGDTDNSEVMRIELDGTVYWRKNGELVKARVDSDLALAFSVVIAEMMGMPADDYIKVLKERSVE